MYNTKYKSQEQTKPPVKKSNQSIEIEKKYDVVGAV
jgi:hypothetical protein